MKPLHDVRSAAQILGISPWTVRGYIRAGKLKPIRLGRLVRLEEGEIQKLVSDAKSGVAAVTDQQTIQIDGGAF
jgi:excisionase family DNA binding protein